MYGERVYTHARFDSSPMDAWKCNISRGRGLHTVRMLGKKSWFAVPNGLQKGEDMPEEVKEIIEELEKAVEPNDFGQGVVFAIQTIKGKYGIDDWEQDG